MRRLALLLAVALGLGCSAAFAATLNVGSWHLWAGSQTLTKGTCTLTGTTQTIDTFVNQASPTQTNGTATTMSVSPLSGSQRWSFVRFDLTSCNLPSTGGADSATLSLRITTAPSTNRTISVTPVLSTWSGTLNWNTAQTLTYGTQTTSFTTGTTSGVTKTVTVTVDVDDQIKTGAVFGWRLSDNGASAFATTSFGTSHNGTTTNRPQLTINYEK